MVQPYEKCVAKYALTRRPSLYSFPLIDFHRRHRLYRVADEGHSSICGIYTTIARFVAVVAVVGVVASIKLRRILCVSAPPFRIDRVGRFLAAPHASWRGTTTAKPKVVWCVVRAREPIIKASGSKSECLCIRMELAGRPSAITAAHAVRHKARRCMRITYLPVFSYTLPHVHFTRRFGIHLGDGPTVGRHSPCFMIRPFCRRQLHTITCSVQSEQLLVQSISFRAIRLSCELLDPQLEFRDACISNRGGRARAARRTQPQHGLHFHSAFFPHTSVAVPQRVDTHTHTHTVPGVLIIFTTFLRQHMVALLAS